LAQIDGRNRMLAQDLDLMPQDFKDWLVKFLLRADFQQGPVIDLEPMRDVGSGTNAAFQNSWTNIGGGLATTAYRKNLLGLVEVRFEASSPAGAGTGNNTAAFTLPAGFRPPGTIRVTGTGTSGVGAETHTTINITSAGVVTPIITGVANNAQASVHFQTIFRP
jgi:hypothetical protein